MEEMMKETIRNQPRYFKDGSVMNNLLESGIEVVWISDLSQNDVVYCICVNREDKKIIVVFRGTVNAHNWKMNFKFDTNRYRNPVEANYPGKEDEISLHSGFALYLLRKRKDTGLSKMDEIFDKIEQIGKELAQMHPVWARTVFTYHSVSTSAFFHAFQYLERTNRIRPARFSCTNDIVPLTLVCNFRQDDLQFYKHVGMRIQLHDTDRVGQWRLHNSLDVTYPLNHDWPSEMQRLLTNNILANLTTPKGFKECHSLTEYQRRLHFAMTYRRALGLSTLNSDQRRKDIKTLDEYYLIRGNILSNGISEKIVNMWKIDMGKNKGAQSALAPPADLTNSAPEEEEGTKTRGYRPREGVDVDNHNDNDNDCNHIDCCDS
eukprot:scaffold34601_cov142-Skeletonema_dohrnii-CCMP3373.AAC.2